MHWNRIGGAWALGLALAAPLAQATTLPAASSLAGLNPGDTYQFVFVTNGLITAAQPSIGGYNAFVQSAADFASIGTAVGVTWKAMVSTGGSPNRAIDNAPVAATTKVYLVDGTMVADGNTHPFYSPQENQDHLHAINVNESAATLSSGFVWTGGNSSGSESGSGLVGGSNPVYGDLSGVLAGRGTGGWARVSNLNPATGEHLYAISSVFTVPVPEPSTWLLMAGGLAGLAGLARRRAA